MKLHPFYLKLIGESIIPILGFFFWEWSLYFILLFYVLDLIVSEVVLHLKTRKIKSWSEKVNRQKWLKYGVFGFVAFVLLTAAILLGTYYLHPGIDLLKETWAFLSYEDMGIAQGYVLVPLLTFMAYASYQTEFIRQKAYQYQEYEVLWKKHLAERGLLIVLAVLLTTIGKLTQLHDGWLLSLILGSIIAYKLLEAKRHGVL